METGTPNMEIDELNMEIDEEPIQIGGANDHNIDPAFKTAKDILNMIISKVCENAEKISNDEDNDSKVIEEILKGMLILIIIN